MANIYKRVFLFLLSFLLPLTISATHIVGGVLNYVYNGSNSYTVTLTLYRDCGGGAAAYPATVNIQVQQANGSEFVPSRDIIGIPGGPITNVPYTLDSCAVPPTPIPCVQVRTYTATVTLPPVSGGYHLYYSLCCRNATLTNTTTSDQTVGQDGESFYAFIPGTSLWLEDFTLPNGTTVDAGATAWTRTLGTIPPGYASVQANLFEVQGANNAQATWTSQIINISTLTAGANLSVDLSEAGNMDPNDSIFTYYSLNGGPLTQFTTNGLRVDDFAAVVASQNGLIGTTVQIIIRVHYDAASPATELYRFDNVQVYNSVSNSNPIYTLFPPLFLCAGNFFTFDHSATDLDGDSLFYSFYTPYADAAPTFPLNVATFTPLIWNAGYSATSPLNAGGPALTLNSATGLLSGTPNSIGQFQVGVKTTEYRSGIKVSDMVRDFQFNIINCPPPAQALITPSGTLSVCSGSTLTFPNNSDVAATNWTWNFGDLSTLLDVSTLQYPTYTYPGPGSYTAMLITNAGTSCADTSTAVVTVTTPPASPTAGSNSPVCVGATLNLTATPVAGATYTWTGPNSFSSTLQNPSIVGVTALAAGTYSVTATIAGCTGPAGTTTVVVNSAPAAPTAGSNSPVCEGSPLNLTANTIAGATYSWTGPNAFSSALEDPTIASPTVLASGTYSVTVTVGGCTGPAGTTSVTVNPTPVAPTVGSNSPVCAGATILLTSNTIAGATYSWTGPAAFVSALEDPTRPAATLAMGGTYSLTVTVAGCTSPVATVTVVVNPTPVAPTAGSNSPVCAGATINLTSNTVAGATYSWTGPSAFTSSLEDPTIASATAAMAGTYSLTVTVAGCTSPVATTIVVVNPTPIAPTAGSNSPVCAGATINLTSNTVAGATYSWTGPSAFSSALEDPTIASATAAMAGTYSLTVTVAGCTSPVATTTVVVNPIPAAPTVGSNSPVCTGSTILLTSNTVAGATYSWTGPAAFVSALEDPTRPSATLAMGGTYSLTVTVAGCTSPVATTTVVVNPTPVAPTAGSNSPVCAGATINLTSNTVAGATYSWTGPSAFSSALEDPTIASATAAMAGTYSLTVTVAGCTSPVATTVVVVNPIPAAPTVGSNSPVCTGATILLTSNTIAGATYSWTGPAAFVSALEDPTRPAATLAMGGTYSLTVTVAGCTSPVATVTVVVNPTPVAPTAGSNSPVCAGATINLTSNTVAGATYSWTGPSAFSSALEDPTIASSTAAMAGTYSLTVTVAGCTSPIATTIVVVNPIPAAPTVGSNSPVCTGTTILLTSNTVAGATYSWTGPAAFVSALEDPTRPAATLAMGGTYSLTVTVAGCTSPVATVTVVVNPTPVAPTAGSNSPVCAGATINLTSNTVAGATYSWTGPSAFSSALEDPTIASATAAMAGTYSVTVTVTGCTSPVATTVVVVNPTPVAPTAGSNSPVCVGATINLTSNTVAGATYSWTGPSAFSSALEDPTIASATLAMAGTYSLTVTVAGCTSPVATTVVVVNPIPAAPTVGSNSPVCTGSTILLTSNTVAGATYSWTGPAAFVSALEDPTRPSATLAMGGTYSLTVTVAGCTSPVATVTVVVNPTPVAPTAGSNSPVCAGATINLTSNTVAGATYSWTGPSAFSSALEDPTIASSTAAMAGTYSLTVTVAGCTSPVATTTVVVNPIPAAPTVGSNSPVCTGATILLTSNTIAGATYSWTGPAAFVSALEDPTRPSATLAMAGTYSLTVTVAGCTSPVATTTVVVNPTPVAPTAGSNSPVCAGTTINLTSNTIAGATYSWTGPSAFTSALEDPTIASATAAMAGTYSVTVTVTGCTSPVATTTVVVNPIPATPTAGSNSPICVGATLNLTTPAVAGATYSWTGPNTFSSALQNPSIVGATAAATGTYSITVTVLGCTSAIGTVAVTVNSAPVSPTAGSNTPVCTGDSLLLTASTIAGATYSWTGPNSFTSTLQNPFIASTTLLAAGTYTVVANNGCASSPATTTVVVNPTPATPTAGSNSPICDGSTLNLTSNTIAGATYSWTGPNSFSSALEDPSIVGATTLASGTYSVTATVGGCTSNPGTTIVTVNPIPAAPTAGSNSPVCTGATILLTSNTVAGATYSWTGPPAFSSSLEDPTRPAATLAMAGTYTLTVTVLGCTSPIATTTVVVNPTPVAPTAGSNSPVCAGTTINLTSNTVAGATYSWTGPSAFTSSLEDPTIASATAAMAGTYSVTVTVTGCTSPVATTTVIVNPIPATPTAGSNSPICVGATLNLTTPAVAGATYSWTGPNSFSSALQNPTIAGATALATGTYSITTTVLGCTSAIGTVAVTVNTAPISPTASSNTPVCVGDSLLLSASTIAGATYSWTGPNSFTSALQNPFIVSTTLLATGTYTVVANNGCASSPATTTVVVNPTPVAPTAGSNGPLCEGATLNLTSNTIAGATYSWTGPNSFSSALEDPSIVGVTAIAAGTYSVSVTVNGCTGPIGTIAVVINQPAIATAGANQTVCANNAIVNIVGTVTGGSTTGIWSTSGTGTFSPSNTSLSATYNPTSADTAAGSITLTLTSTLNGACAASVSSLVITITNAPTVNAGVNQSVCANNANTNLNGIVTTASGGVWSTSGSGTFSPDNITLNATYIPSAADTTSGTVTLVLTSTGNGTCLAVSDTMNITITNAPIANAGVDQFVCLSSPNATLSGTIIGGAGTGIWTTSGSGTFSPSAISLNTTYIPSTADTAAGSVVIILTTTANGGCAAASDTMTINYTIIPTVDAGANQTVCANNASVLLNGTVNGTSNTGIWSTSGSGTFSPSDSTLNATYIPSAADTTAGSVTLTLSSTNSCAVITDAMVITITDGPSVSAGADVNVCSNNPDANLTAVIGGATTTGIWSTIGTGTITPSTTSLAITYSPSATDITNGSVDLIITSTGNGTCNAVSDTVTIIITPPPAAFAGNDTSICANTNLQLSGVITGGVGTGNWTTSGTGTFSPASNILNAIYIPSSADTSSGTVTLTLTSTNNGGCIAVSDDVVVTITNAPIANAGIDQTVCSNNPAVALSGSVTGASGGIWSTSGTGTFDVATNLNANYTPSAADILSGTITLTITTTGNGGCVAATDLMIVTFSPSPIVNANANQFICTGITTAVLNGSVSDGSTTGIWTTLGSGTFSLDTDMNATYTLSSADTTAGSVTLILTSTSNGNCLAVSDTMQITITTIPTSTAGLDQILCANNASIILNGIITGGSGMGQWSTYNGTGSFSPSDTTLNAIYNSSAADTAQGFVSLVLTPINACLNVPDTLQITFTPAPFIFAGNDQSICNGGTISLSATMNAISSGMIWTTSGTGTFTPDDSTLVVTYNPSVGDATLDTIYFYATTTGNGNCFAATDTVMVLLGTTPVANFTSSGNCSGQVVSFTDASTVSTGTINGWVWDFGDTNTSLLQNPTNIYTTAGTYTVTLVASSGAGCSDSIVKVIVINPLPIAAFSYVSSCTSDSVLFTDNSTISSGAISQWSWNFGDSTSSVLQNPIQIYSVIDTFSVTLTVTSDSGCVANITQNVIVAPRPTANFAYSINCATGIVIFTDSSIVSGGDTIISYNWNFGNGNTSTLQNPLPVTYNPGTYVVQLVVTTQGGCSDMDTVTIVITAPPIADYIPQGGQYQIGQTINFTDQSQNATAYYWTFGNNNDTSIVQNPSYSYGANGSYIVTLIASNASGCSDTAAYQFEIIGSSVVVPTAFSPNGDGLNDFFSVKGGPFNSYELRVFNEWGQQIFISNSQDTGWDGTYKRKDQPAGSYVYIFVGVSYTNEEIKMQGEIAITR